MDPKAERILDLPGSCPPWTLGGPRCWRRPCCLTWTKITSRRRRRTAAWRICSRGGDRGDPGRDLGEKFRCWLELEKIEKNWCFANSFSTYVYIYIGMYKKW
jgi:hypothetical protein